MLKIVVAGRLRRSAENGSVSLLLHVHCFSFKLSLERLQADKKPTDKCKFVHLHEGYTRYKLSTYYCQIRIQVGEPPAASQGGLLAD